MWNKNALRGRKRNPEVYLKYIFCTLRLFTWNVRTSVLYRQIVNMQITRSKCNWFCKLVSHDRTFITNTHALIYYRRTAHKLASHYNSCCHGVPIVSHWAKTFSWKKRCSYCVAYVVVADRVKQKLIVVSHVFGLILTKLTRKLKKYSYVYYNIQYTYKHTRTIENLQSLLRDEKC